jgi:hypothetical protein
MTQKKPKPNQYNNPIVQALLDTKKLLWDEDIQLDNIDDIIEEFENNEHLRESATKLWTSHKIPDKSVRFIMSLVYNCCPERFELPRDEQLILDLMERIQNQLTGTVAIIKKDFVDILHFTDTQRKNLQKSLNHLSETGFITCIYQPPQGDTKHPAVYILNRNVSWIGAPTNTALNIHMKNFVRKYKQVVEPVILPDGTTINCGMIKPYSPEEKKEVCTDQNADLTDLAETKLVSAPHSDCNKLTVKIQEDNAFTEMPGQMTMFET